MKAARSALLAGTVLSTLGLTGWQAHSAPAELERLAQAGAGQGQQPEPNKPGEKKAPAKPQPAKPPGAAAPQGAPPHQPPPAAAHPPANPAPPQPQQRHVEPPAQQHPPAAAAPAHPPAAAAPAHPQSGAPAAQQERREEHRGPQSGAPAAQQERREEHRGPQSGAPASQQERREEHRGPGPKGGVAQPGQAAPGKPAAQQPGSGQHAPAQSASPGQPAQGPAAAPNQTAQPGTQQPGAGAAAVRRASPSPNGNPGAVPPPAQPINKGQFIAPKGQAPTANINQLHQQRQEVREGNRVFIREPDRTIIEEGNRTIIQHNEVDRFAVGARDVHVDRRGNETVAVVVRPDGVQIINTTDAEGHLLRRVRRDPNGREIILVDNSFAGARPRDVFVELPPPVIRIPRDRYIVEANDADEPAIYNVFVAPPVEAIQQRYTLDQVRYSEPLRARMPRVDLDITFDTGSWQLTPDQVERLSVTAEALNRAISRNPQEVFLIEGHTDAVGNDVDNLSLSDRRAESVAVALSEEFQVPAENLVTQGYGKQDLKVRTSGPERANRRVAIRRITPLIDANAR